MSNSVNQISENIFQKQHAEAVQALIWALALLKENKRKNQAFTFAKSQKIAALKITHAQAIEQDPELGNIFQQIQDENVDVDALIQKLQSNEQQNLDDLERKASRHKLSIFFAFFMALGCGTTIAGSNFLMGAEQGWIMNIWFLSTLVIVSLPIILSVTIANWWLGVRAVSDLENKNKDPYKLVEEKLGEYKAWKAPLFALGIFLIEIYNGLGLNMKKEKEPTNGYKVNRLARVALYASVLLGALIYAFFAFAATYNLGMGIFGLMQTKGLVGAGGFQTAAITSAVFGVLMAVPTYITMKVIYYVYGRQSVMVGEGPLDIIDSIPGLTPNLRRGFIFCAFLIVASVAFMTYAATAPLAAWFHLAGMGAGAKPLATAAIAIAFVGNVPFFLLSAAKSFKQLFDPREKLKEPHNKWFPYVRFWNALLNALPVVVGIFAFCGLIAMPGPWSIFLPVILNFIVSPAGGIASYFANSNGSPTMYQFDPAKQISKFQINVLNRLKNNEPLVVEYERMTPDQQLQAEFLGAKSYMEEECKDLDMPVLANAIYTALINRSLMGKHYRIALHQALTNRPMNIINRIQSFLFHGNVHYTQQLFSYDYLDRIEHFASNDVKVRLYTHALMGGGKATSIHTALLVKTLSAEQFPLETLTLGSNAELFWKCYAVKSLDEQNIIMNHIPEQYRNQPQIQGLLMKHSAPEIKEKIIESLLSKITSPDSKYQHFLSNNRLSIQYPISGFWLKNLAFPLVLLFSGITAAMTYVAKRIPVLAPYAAERIDIYEYLTESAATATRVKYLTDVLKEYIETKPDDSATARTLSDVISGNNNATFKPTDSLALGSGVIGRVFTLAGQMPEIKRALEAALGDKPSEDIAETSQETIRTETSSRPLFFSTERSRGTINPLCDDVTLTPNHISPKLSQ